jgi:FkbM family methyltransferase
MFYLRNRYRAVFLKKRTNIMTTKSKIKQFVLKITGKVGHLRKGVKLNHVWYGNAHAGFYLCPEFLDQNSIVYSFGIGENVSFDKAVIEKHDCHVFGFDPTPKSINWIKGQKLHEKFHFSEFGISNKSGLVDFYLPNNPEYVSGSSITQKNVDVRNKVSVGMKSLADIMNELGHKHIDVLKMDIEGSEYDVIENILNAKISITQILVEFHDRFVENGNLKSKQTVEALKSNGYEIFAVSDSFEEISFINKNAL